MTGKNIQTRMLSSSKPFPYDLLLLADEAVEAIDKYIQESTIYVIEKAGGLIGVYVFCPIQCQTVEIKNIATGDLENLCYMMQKEGQKNWGLRKLLSALPI